MYIQLKQARECIGIKNTVTSIFNLVNNDIKIQLKKNSLIKILKYA